MNYLLYLLILAFHFKVSSQSNTITIESIHLNENRKIIIGLPSSYDYDTNTTKYPLLLITDGEWHFNLVFEASNLLYQNGLPKMIVAAIVNTNRERDLTFSKTSEFKSSGGADNFHKFIKHELLEELRKRYRIASHKTLLGHSAGGLFATYIAHIDPDLFNAYITVTPTVRWDNFKLLSNSYSNNLNTLLSSRKHFFLSIGNEEGDEKLGVLKLSEKLSLKESVLSYQFKSYPNQSHTVVPWKAYFDGLQFVFSDFNLTPELANAPFKSIVKHYKKLGEYFDYDNRVPQRVIMNRGYFLLEEKELEKAKTVYEYYKKYYPNVPFGYTGLGDTYYRLKDYKLSKENFEKAYKLFPTKDLEVKLQQLTKLIKE